MNPLPTLRYARAQDIWLRDNPSLVAEGELTSVRIPELGR